VSKCDVTRPHDHESPIGEWVEVVGGVEVTGVDDDVRVRSEIVESECQ
jgi:hypothetical protein